MFEFKKNRCPHCGEDLNTHNNKKENCPMLTYPMYIPAHDWDYYNSVMNLLVGKKIWQVMDIIKGTTFYLDICRIDDEWDWGMEMNEVRNRIQIEMDNGIITYAG